MQDLDKAKSIVIACDQPPDQFESLVEKTTGIPGIGGYKIGMALGLRGLEKAVETVRLYVRKSTVLEAWGPKIIFDYQKAGNDIPEMGAVFAGEVLAAGAKAAILFPLAGPETQKKWTEACFKAELKVILGLAMTHPNFFVSEGGYITDDAPEKAFRLACDMGVRNFVVPGNKVHWVVKLRAILVEKLGEGNFVLYAPGFITQGGDISECGAAAGNHWHAIIGSAIYKKPPEKIRGAAIALGERILDL